MKKLSLFIGLSFLLCACEEDNLSDDYYKEFAYQKKFEEQFGKIAPGHQWGFDLAEAAFNMQQGLTRAVIKMDMPVVGNLLPYQVFHTAPNITEREHAEVYQWFSNHKVNWAVTPTYFQKNLFDAADEATYNYRTIATTDTGNPAAHYIEGSSWNVAFTDEDNNQISGTNSLLGDPANLCQSDYPLNNLIGVPHAWVQHVANNPSDNNHMDYLQCWGLEAEDDRDPHWQAHLNDANGGRGWGYQRQDPEGHYNALLVTYANVDIWSYGNSVGSSYPHDKYFIAYLKGDGYEGYYLGFDFESWGDNENEKVAADGICNDWIIKVTDIGNMIKTPKFRIMCEDLGYTYDWDFNDVVYDVEYTDQHICNITLQAAGGTMPIRLQYRDHVLYSSDQKDEIHSIYGVSTTTPVNVNASRGADGKSPVTIKIAFPGADDYWANGCNLDLHNTDIYFSLGDLNIYVKTSEEAQWISKNNKEGEAPYKFALPIIDNYAPNWMKEELNIKTGYELFEDWIADPTIEFWDKVKYSNKIHTSEMYQ